MLTSEHRIVAELLRTLREEAGLTQSELANRMGISQSAVSKLESAERRLEVVEARAFCGAIGVNLPEFARRLESHFRGAPNAGR